MRNLLFWLHLTIGFAAGLPILVMCITGTLLTYQIQLQAWIDHWGIQSRPALPGAQALTIEDLLAITHRNRGSEPRWITVFRQPRRPVEVKLDGVAEPVYLDAHTGSVIGGPSRKAREFFGLVRAWHLGLSPRGPHWSQFRVVERAVNLLALVTTILGLLIWFPRRWSWRHLRGIALPRWGVAGRARDFNWHNALGIWTVIPLIVILWTGTAMSYAWASRLTELMWRASSTESRGGGQDVVGLSKGSGVQPGRLVGPREGPVRGVEGNHDLSAAAGVRCGELYNRYERVRRFWQSCRACAGSNWQGLIL